MGIIRRKRGYSGGWRKHGDDARTALQLVAAGMVRFTTAHCRDSAERFVEMGYAVRLCGCYALTGRGTLAALRSSAVWAEARLLRRVARRVPSAWAKMPIGYPFVPSAAMLQRARGLGADPVAEAGVNRAIEAASEAAGRSPLVEAAQAAGIGYRGAGAALGAGKRDASHESADWLRRQGFAPPGNRQLRRFT